MQIINCTYRGSRARYYVSKPYPYYATDAMTAGITALDGTMYTALAELTAEELTVGMFPLTSELRTILQTYNASTGAIDGSIPATSGNVEQITTQVTTLSGTLVQVLFSHTQPTDEMLAASILPLDGTLLQVLVTHSQPIEAVEASITALDGTLI